MKELDLKKLDSMPSCEIDELRLQALKEYSDMFNALSVVREEILVIQLNIIGLQREKKQKEITEEKGRQALNTIRTQAKILESKFWSSKNDSR
jgi:DNA-directed RNA polymerase alpha subunit